MNPTRFAPIGWDDKPALGLSLGCCYWYADDRYTFFDAGTLEATMRLVVERQPLLVSFNGIAFDFPLMRGLLRREADAAKPTEPGVPFTQYGPYQRLTELCDVFKLQCATSYDLLAEIWKVDPERKFERGLNSLDALSQANGLGAKEMDGATAPVLWRQGQVAAVATYNLGDVWRTKNLFQLILQNDGKIKRGDGSIITLKLPNIA